MIGSGSRRLRRKAAQADVAAHPGDVGAIVNVAIFFSCLKYTFFHNAEHPAKTTETRRIIDFFGIDDKGERTFPSVSDEIVGQLWYDVYRKFLPGQEEEG